MISYEKGIELKLSSNRVYYIACSLLIILKNPCSKLHHQKILNLILFLHKVRPEGNSHDWIGFP